MAIGRFAELRALEQEVHSLEEQLTTRRIVERARGLLMDTHKLSESDAFAFIQQSAMRQRAKMRVVAEQVLDGSLAPGGSGATG